MQWLTNLLMIVQVLSALGVIILVLLQHGKGADMGAAFGSGASGSLFGAAGSANFLSRLTGAMATVFFVVTLGLALMSHSRPEAPASVMDSEPAKPAADAPKLPADVPPVGPAGSSTPQSGGADASSAPKSGAGGDIPK